MQPNLKQIWGSFMSMIHTASIFKLCHKMTPYTQNNTLVVKTFLVNLHHDIGWKQLIWKIWQ